MLQHEAEELTEQCAALKDENDVLNETIQLSGAISMDSPAGMLGGCGMEGSLLDEMGGGGFEPEKPANDDGQLLGAGKPGKEPKVLRLRLSAKWLVSLDRKEEARLIRLLILQLKKLTFLEVYIR